MQNDTGSTTQNATFSNDYSMGRRNQQRRNWTDLEERTLLDVLEALVVEGYRGENGTFKVGAHEEVCKRMGIAIPGINVTTKHVINKLKRWHTKVVQVTDMINTSGFGWDDVRKCVVVDSEQVLAEYLNKHPKVSNHVNREFKEFDKLQTIFGRDRATGQRAEGAHESVANQNANSDYGGIPEVDEVYMGCDSPASIGNINVGDANVGNAGTSETARHRKKSRNMEVNQLLLENIEKSMLTVSSRIEAAAEKIVSGKFDSMSAIEALALTSDDEMDLLDIFGDKPKMEERFMRLPADERLAWVKKLLARS